MSLACSASAGCAWLHGGGRVEVGLAPRVAHAHGGIEAWRSLSGLRTRLVVARGGEPTLVGTMLWEPHDNLVRIECETPANTTLVFDGERAWATPTAQPIEPPPRFQLLTWTYFLGAPFKLSDPGAILYQQRDRELRGASGPSGRLSFEAGVGDSPEDWYIVYLERKTDRLRALAYIVTYGARTAREAKQNPHCAYYESLTSVETPGGTIELPDHITIWDWRESEGLIGEEPLWRIRFEDLESVEIDRSMFTAPTNAVEDELPADPDRPDGQPST